MSQWVASTFLSSSFTQSSLIPSVFSFSGFSNHQLSLSTRCRSIQLSFPLGLMFCGQQSDFLITTNLVSHLHRKPSKTWVSKFAHFWPILIICVQFHTIWKVKFLSKNSILTKTQYFNEFFTQFFFDNFSREIKVVNS